MLYRVLKPVFLALAGLLFRLEARGRAHVPRTGPVLFVANHSSLLDPPLIAAAAPRVLSFLAKEELFGIPVFGWLIRRFNAIPLRREGGSAGMMRAALRVLERAGALLVFPEGTRGAEGVLRPSKPGAGLLAVLSGAPVVPVYISGTGRAWPRGRRLPRPAKVTVTFGAPLRFGQAGGDRRESYEAAGRHMMAAIARLTEAAATGGDERSRSRMPAQIH